MNISGKRAVMKAVTVTNGDNYALNDYAMRAALCRYVRLCSTATLAELVASVASLPQRELVYEDIDLLGRDPR